MTQNKLIKQRWTFKFHYDGIINLHQLCKLIEPFPDEKYKIDLTIYNDRYVKNALNFKKKYLAIKKFS